MVNANPGTQTRVSSSNRDKVREGLEKLRVRLLDLTSRNKLISFRHGASTIRIVNADLDELYRRLTAGEKLAFQYVPEPTREEIDEWGEKPNPRQYAEELGWSVSLDLAVGKGRADVLCALHYKEDFETLVRKVATTAKTALDESGTNLLHLVFGFLEWRESDDSTQVRHAPLLVVPVRLLLPRAAQADRAIQIYYDDGDALMANLSLVEKMRRDFGIEIPTLDEGEAPAHYYARVQQAVEHKRDWRICRQISVGLLSFAKLLMYLDLDVERWPLLGEHDRLVEMFASDRTEGMSFATEYELDDELKRVTIPNLICDADSSQHSALVDATHGKNVVIEGPPGTGKSQTITNLIAAFLAQGKRVLFVAEKMAALEVVKRRLDKAHLGDFCLELHSHKTNKVALLKSIERRIAAHQSFSEPSILANRQSMLDNHRGELMRYVKLLNRPYAGIARSPFEIIWARDSVRRTINDSTIEPTGVAFPNSEAWTAVEFEQRKDTVSIYQAHVERYIAAGGSTVKESNPWAWLPNHDLDLFAQEELLKRLQTLRDLCQRQLELVEVFDRRFGGIGNHPEAWLRDLTGWFEALPASSKITHSSLFGSLKEPSSRDSAIEFCESVETYIAAKTALPQCDHLVDTDAAELIELNCEKAKAHGYTSFTLTSLRAVISLVQSARQQSIVAERAIEEFSQMLGVAYESSFQCLSDIAQGRALILETPVDILHLRGPAFEQEGLLPRLRKAKSEASELIGRCSQLAPTLDFGTSHSISDLESAASTLNSTPWFLRWFSSSYRRAKGLFQSVSRSHEKFSNQQMSGDLQRIAELRRSIDAFSDRYRGLVTEDYRGIQTEWDALIRLAEWYENLAVRLAEHSRIAREIRQNLLTFPATRLKSVIVSVSSGAAEGPNLQSLVHSLERLHSLLPWIQFDRQSTPIDEFLHQADESATVGKNVLEAVLVLGVPDATSDRDLTAWIAETRRLREVRSSLQMAKRPAEVLGPAFQGCESDTNQIRMAVDFVSKVDGSCLPEGLKGWLLCSDYGARAEFLRSWLTDFAANSDALRKAELSVSELLSKELPFVKRTSQESLKRAITALQGCLDNAKLLPMWIDVRHAADRLQTDGLQYLVESIGDGHLESSHLRGAFEFLFYDSLIRQLFNENPELWRITGISHEETRRKFAELDKAVIELTQLEVAYKASKMPVPRGERGKAKETTEYALLQHEIGKQRAHIPIRQLLLRAGLSVQALKPCFMMSPMSVAQFLEPGHLDFDLVVMDEASQLRPEDALGAIARGAQLVVVGDPKQLPPTSFFQRTISEEDEPEEQTMVAENDSILDISLGLYQPVRRLRWHYRSQHHSLIAYSNEAFYDNDLVVFPSAYQDHPDLGVKFVGVSGVLQNRVNSVEAQQLVEAILNHIVSHPTESLGVVTMNFDQRELIEEMLYARIANDSYASSWIEDRESSAEPFFIKNLENVQGDERDVIFISVTYGKDAQGNLFQRFAGVNTSSGHRRLNVMVTRSKRRTVVFSSIDGDDIKVTGSTPWGVRALKGYLDFAKRGISAQPEISPGAEPSNEHEAAIGYFLKNHGYEVVPQVGISGYFIDLAVRHPHKPGAFLLGIEFDGKSYHSGRSVRDRDRLRQMTLERQGWKIHRIWSTDWFKNRVAEEERLLGRVRDLALIP